MKSRPIIFKAEMVRAILDGLKTQTRRLVDPQPVKRGPFWEFAWGAGCSMDHLPIVPGHATESACPYGKPGDLIWVRENTVEDCTGSVSHGRYVADDAQVSDGRIVVPWWYSRRSCPSIHMPRTVSRLTLRITDIRVERLQEISRADAIAEGCAIPGLPREIVSDANDYCADERTSFAILWQSINGPKSWNEDPWVWVIEFEPIQANVDSVMEQEA